MTNTREERVAPKPWPFFGYAPGNYMGTCSLGCGETITGIDKRALRCLPCAVLAAKAHMASVEPSPDVWEAIESAPKDGTRIIIGWHENGQVRGVSAARWVDANFWADLENGDPEDFEADWYEPGYEDVLCANVWMRLPDPPKVTVEEDRA